MTTGFRTVVTELTPLPPLPAGWTVFHVCRECLADVKTADLVGHAKVHRALREALNVADDPNLAKGGRNT